MFTIDRLGGALIAASFLMPLPNALAASLTDEQVSQSYIYLLGRLLITRQQQLDFQEGFEWNELVHRKPGAVDWPNPNLDVAYSEAWVAVDETSCTIVTVELPLKNRTGSGFGLTV